ncbi:monofunctional biosynthetic peptidoglycan transglycosylase [Novosphingobium piscinae]|uniref:Biosynthetic peptidoglycan transglycosylase n=2 Tax=Novosphingobium piscinae TaxID=1507448 RepID=A0A7X1G0F1_9SPHN|nr:monofunctional biosynthetic peptidoglycan transglycosylase [Novosphingobium piscinae]MBC2670383.1 monofunctional biosynthetic peptidoglycan transglycosylase [Novosphingobium piscinae]
MRWGRPGPNAGFGTRLASWIARGILAFVGLSLLFTVAYKWVPVPVTATMVMDPNGFTKDWTPLTRIDPDMVAAVIAGEDGKFCSHSGFDTAAIEQAWERNRRGGRIRGGSTISQQTAKNVFLWQGGGYVRKALEAWFTVLIEQIWGKRRIMEVYLNVAETGIGTYGVEAGAQRYYGHSAARLSAVEAARIAAALPSPKKRAVTGATGFTRRHGNVIARRTTVVRRSDYDACVYE